MRAELINIANQADNVDRQIAGASDMEIVTVGAKTFLVVSGAVDGGISTYEMLNDGTLVPAADLPNSASSGTVAVSDLTVMEIGGKVYILPSGNFDNNQVVYEITNNGSFVVTDSYTDAAGTYRHWFMTDAASVNGSTYVFGTQWGEVGLFEFDMVGDMLANPFQHPDDIGMFLGDVRAIEAASLHGRTFLFVASGVDAGLHSFEVMPDGSIILRDTAPASEGGISGASDLTSIDTGDRKFVILASAGTDSLLVYRVSQGGKLKHVETLTDTGETRFADVSDVEAFTYDGRHFVLAAGSDDGLTLMEIDYRGRLKVLDTIVDTAATHLQDITDIEVREVGGQMYVYVSSGVENGISAFALDLPNGENLIRGTPDEDNLTGTALDDTIFGHGKADVIHGLGGNDRLIDGLGPDELWGGAGADIFEFVPDNRTDRIMDYDIGVDRIDLSGYALLYNISDLVITARADGATIDVDGDLIRIFSDDGQPLDVSMFTQDDFIFG